MKKSAKKYEVKSEYSRRKLHTNLLTSQHPFALQRTVIETATGHTLSLELRTMKKLYIVCRTCR